MSKDVKNIKKMRVKSQISAHGAEFCTNVDVCEFAKTELQKYSEAKYKKFTAALIPGTENILGVRLPTLRKIAKEIAKGDWQYFLDSADEKYMEDTMLLGLVLAYIKEDFEKMLKLTANFVPKINNWAVCDTFCNGLKFVKKDMCASFNFLMPYLKSKDEYRLRFGVVMLLSHFIEPEFIDEVLEILFNLKSEYYYARMAIAWAISICYIKFPEKTYKYLIENDLDDFTHNKSISKIIESYRVSAEDKNKLRKLRRK